MDSICAIGFYIVRADREYAPGEVLQGSEHLFGTPIFVIGPATKADWEAVDAFCFSQGATRRPITLGMDRHYRVQAD